MRLRVPSDLPDFLAGPIQWNTWDVDNSEKQGMLGQEIHSPRPAPAVLNL